MSRAIERHRSDGADRPVRGHAWQRARAEVSRGSGRRARVGLWHAAGRARRDLFLKDEVYGRELLETAAQGALHVRLLDDSMLRLGSAARASWLTRSSTRPMPIPVPCSSASPRACARFVSGKGAKHRVEVSTPAATIAARGTESGWISRMARRPSGYSPEKSRLRRATAPRPHSSMRARCACPDHRRRHPSRCAAGGTGSRPRRHAARADPAPKGDR